MAFFFTSAYMKVDSITKPTGCSAKNMAGKRRADVITS